MNTPYPSVVSNTDVPKLDREEENHIQSGGSKFLKINMNAITIWKQSLKVSFCACCKWRKLYKSLQESKKWCDN